jgi:aryl-alcohol dehydrogenase-like predicted oxidoreductase
MSIDIRKIGSQGLEASAQGLGCMGMSEFYGDADRDESIATIHRAIELGVTLFDTSDMYGSGHNEELLREALAGRRDQVVIATKFGIMRDEGNRSINGRPEHVHKAADESLKRLGSDYIDLYYQHRVDPDVPIEETVGAMGELVAAGKVRYLGLSEASSDQIRTAHDTHPITALQTEYSLWTRDVEEVVLPAVRELGIGFVPYSPLGRGFLTGKLKKTDDLAENDFRRNNPRFADEHRDRNVELVEKVEAIAEKKGVTAGQLALAWVHNQGDDVFPIPGTKRRTYLEENVAAASIELTAEELSQLDDVAPLGAASGDRYPAGHTPAIR